MCLVHPPVLLYSDRGQLRPPWALEHPGGYLDDFAHIVFVCNTVEQLFIARLVSQILGASRSLSKRNQLLAVDVSQVDLVSGQELLEKVDDVRDGAPLGDVSTLEREELGGLIENLALADDELMQREDVQELVVGARLLIEFGGVFEKGD